MQNSLDFSLMNEQELEPQELAYRFIAETNISVFLTGKAGTGKTTFLHRLVEEQPKRLAVVAPTGIAAINAKGMTIHSFFQLPLGPHIPGDNSRKEMHFRMSNEKKKILRTLDLLIIDEISMVRCDLLDYVDEVLRKYKDHEKPFGGVQLLMIGDVQQLAPVTKEGEWELLKPYYSTPYFFGSNALQHIQYVTIELQHIYRQNDNNFISLLAKIRNNCLDAQSLQILNQRYIPNFIIPKDEDWIRLTTHNKMANEYNKTQLEALCEKQKTFEAIISGNFPETSYPAEQHLQLKKGAQVMFLKNDISPRHQYYNGKIGTIIGFNEESILVESKEDNSIIEVTPAEWINTRYIINEETKEIEEIPDGTFIQYPLRLAWAITIHKSQGLTFDHAVLDVNSSFAHGQVYVALSRCRTLEGLVLTNPLTPYAIISDYDVDCYITNQLESAKNISSNLSRFQQEYFCLLLNELFSFEKLKYDFLHLIRVVEEHLYSAYEEYNEILKNLKDQFETKIFNVAIKFQSQYMGIIYNENCDSTTLQERIHKASDYFTTELIAVFTPVLSEYSALHIPNKSIKELYNNAIDALVLSYSIKVLTLKDSIDNDFSIKRYLSIKSKAALQPQIQQLTSQKKKVQKTKKEENVKEPKISTKDITLNLYLEGNSIKEISKIRNLKIATIEDHIATLIGNGKLDINDFVSREHQIAISRVIDSFESSYNLSDIKSKLPEDYSYLEIKTVIACR